jgi:TonB-linked SusC/RagA family outer membrane protein
VEDLSNENPNLWQIPFGDIETLTAGSGASIRTLASTLFRLNYTYDDRYLFTGNFRRDGSSKFGPNNRYGNFASAALGWNISNESFMATTNNWLNVLKLRASYGLVGNEKIGGNQQFTLVQNGQNAVFGPDESLVPGLSYGTIGNPDLQWESTRSTNIGIDFALLDNRLSGDLNYYEKTTEDILVGLFSPGHQGNGPFVTTTRNAAEVKNNGFEFRVQWQDDLENGIYYSIGVLGTTVNNEVLEVGRDEGANSFIPGGSLGNGQLITRTEVGFPIGAFYGYEVAGVIQDENDLANSPTLSQQGVGDLKYKDLDNSGVIDEDDQTVLGSYIPDFTYGFNLNVGFKGISLGLDFYGESGSEIYNGKNAVRPNQYNYEQRVYNYIEALNNGEISDTEPRPTSGGVNYTPSDYFVQDGSFFRLRTATLAYELPKQLIGNIGFEQVRVYLRGTNVFTLSEYTGYTPEINSGNVLGSGIDLGVFPVTSVYSAGVNISF